jgi:ribosomal protein S27E
MKELQKEFIGRGEVKGFIFTQIKKSNNAYIYKVDCDGCEHYEVFKHKENTQFKCISYPKTGSFGLWAWTYKSFESALEKYDLLNLEKEL